MSVSINQLIDYLNTLLEPELFRDYCPNGLQVAGQLNIETLVTGVTASEALIDRAIDTDAQAILVHHGYFWKGEDPSICGIKKNRLKKLLSNNINLIAYHLPLDVHPIYGNNVQLAQILNFKIDDQFAKSKGFALGCISTVNQALSGVALADHIKSSLCRQPLHIAGSDSQINRVAWVTGAAQDFITEAAQCGADAFITGEISERTVLEARELGIHFYAAGHHATERYGVKALGEHLADRFDITHHFIDIDNPV